MKSAPEVFHRTVAELFSDIEGVETYVDDFLIHGTTEEEHDARLKPVLNRCRSINLHLNASKCKFKQTELSYLGHIISHNSLKPDERKAKAIRDMPEPENKADLRRILGMVTYLSKFCPNLSTLAAPLRDLTRKECEWTWDETHRQALRRVKELVNSTSELQLFDPNKPSSCQSTRHNMGSEPVSCMMDNQLNMHQKHLLKHKNGMRK